MKIILSVLLLFLLSLCNSHAGVITPVRGLTGVTSAWGTPLCLTTGGIVSFYINTYATASEAQAAAQAAWGYGEAAGLSSRTTFVDQVNIGHYYVQPSSCLWYYYGFPLPHDTDSDGVKDAVDYCLSTASGDHVDYLGCSCLQNGNCTDKLHPIQKVFDDNNNLLYIKLIDDNGNITEYGNRDAIQNCVNTGVNCGIIDYNFGPNPDIWDMNLAFYNDDLSSQLYGLSQINPETGIPYDINNGIPSNIPQIALGENNNTTNSTEVDFLSDIVINTQRNTDNQQEIVNQITQQNQTLQNINNNIIQQGISDNTYNGPSADAIGQAVGDQVEQKIGNVPVGYSDDPEAPIDDIENSVGTFVDNYMTTVKNLPILDALDSIQINTTAPVSSLTINNIFTDDPIVVDFAPYYSQIHSVGIFLLGFSSIYWFVYIFRGSW